LPNSYFRTITENGKYKSLAKKGVAKETPTLHVCSRGLTPENGAKFLPEGRINKLPEPCSLLTVLALNARLLHPAIAQVYPVPTVSIENTVSSNGSKTQHHLWVLMEMQKIQMSMG